MTTHDQHTEVGSHDEVREDRHDEVQPVTAETQPLTEHTAPTEYAADPSTAPAESTMPNESAPVNGDTPPAVSAEHSGVERESSTERSLFAEDQLAGLRARWNSVQAEFVDDPKQCVQKADGLVSDLVDQLTAGFADARSRLEDQWSRGEQASTEDLRVALKHYREFFERLLVA
jgi:hypothetical protein